MDAQPDRRCFECDAPAECDHHIVPRSRGGTRTVPMCGACHGKAHHRKKSMATSTLTREGILRRRDAGVPIGRAATSSPYGWRWVLWGEKSYLVIDEGERRRIEHLQKLRDTGLSLERVCVATSMAEHRWVNEGRRWYPMSVRAALMARAKGYPPCFMRATSSATVYRRALIGGKVRSPKEVASMFEAPKFLPGQLELFPDATSVPP